jgi:elongator complex protein 3
MSGGFHAGILRHAMPEGGLKLEFPIMEELLLDIISRLNEGPLDRDELAQIIRRHNDNVSDVSKHLSKKKLLPFYQQVKANEPERWRSWGIDDATERKLFQTLRMKPRRTSSGVATITVITRPQPCTSNCIYCPNDLRMPKSYLSNEPACQRAERNWFDPYLQVVSRMRALTQMGHATDKVELIVLGGTWSDYPQTYQIWFMRELFRALNDWPGIDEATEERRLAYENAGISNDASELALFAASEQSRVNTGDKTYNQAFHDLYDNSDAHRRAAKFMVASMKELEAAQTRNETADHRVVGLVIETRPDTVTPENLTLFRRFGCTKIQVGIQSTRPEILHANNRATSVEQIKRAFALIRLFGFKIHSHLMLNLVGATPAEDKDDFATFVTDAAFLPDEIKLYPCALVQGTALVSLYESGEWRPYTEDELLDVLVTDTLATPPYIRISRMIRDISAEDIMVGNKKTNLRQMVEGSINECGRSGAVREIRFREINQDEIDLEGLRLDDYIYETSLTTEHFLQWVTSDYRIAGFLRLSLPHWTDIASRDYAPGLPTGAGEAMIREVHVYGHAAHLGKSDASAQHRGLGRALVNTAEKIAADAGYTKLNVISSVGTREYYRHLGFEDNGLYQRISVT